mgnify:CR=1 FL=1|tara:strand:+ start:5219 stop:5491 length:273 start_codon:yes stop_codon:yes gene_type:complete
MNFREEATKVHTDLMTVIVENDCIIADGYNYAIVGISYGANPRAIYSTYQFINLLIAEGMTEEDAIEHFEFNVIGGVPTGDNSPIFINDR